MNDYISREAFVGKYREVYCQDCDRRKGVKNGRMQFLYAVGDAPCRACDIGDMLDAADDFPAADVVEVVHGEWLRYGEDGYPNTVDTVAWQCDQCLETYYGRTTRVPNYCPNCGAKMDVPDTDVGDKKREV